MEAADLKTAWETLEFCRFCLAGLPAADAERFELGCVGLDEIALLLQQRAAALCVQLEPERFEPAVTREELEGMAHEGRAALAGLYSLLRAYDNEDDFADQVRWADDAFVGAG
jgi:hypothetical protein